MIPSARCLRIVFCLFALLSSVAGALTVERQTVELTPWKHNEKEFILLVLSDLHAAETDGALMDEVVKKGLAEKPDAVALLGDYRYGIDPAHTMPPAELARRLAPLAKDKRPVLYILGNHDQGGYAAELEKAFLSAGFSPLDGKTRRLRLDRNRSMELCGVSFIFGAGKDQVLAKLPKKTAAGVPLIVLAHSPYVFLKNAFPSVELVLAGHTHGGQLCKPDGTPLRAREKLTPAMQRGGWHTMPSGKKLYITRGIGFSQVPMRLCCPPEITIMTFR